MRDAFQEIGVVEGFYGRVWTPLERETFIDTLLPFGLNIYLYAPKHETALGGGLMEPLQAEAAQRLKKLAGFCAKRKIALWMGLHLEAPLKLSDAAHLQRVAEKVAQLTDLGVRGFAVLFDDVPAGEGSGHPGGEDPFGGSTAAAHAHAFNTLRNGARKSKRKLEWLLCPSRYTLDPKLEIAHGRFEAGYLKTLQGKIPKEVPWLWTGPGICSPGISPADAAAYRAEAGAGEEERPLMLWDNYPVNDLAMSSWLHLDPLGGRSPDLPQSVRGYLFNPMLQPVLGVLPGATCLMYANDPAGYRASEGWERALGTLIPEAMRMLISEFAALTRPHDPTGGLPPAWPRGSFPLVERLQRGWQAMSVEAPVEPYVVMDFRRVVTALENTLPEAMLGEARPWLNRLRQSLSLFEAILDGAPVETLGPLRAQYVARDAAGPPAEVLGTWFP